MLGRNGVIKSNKKKAMDVLDHPYWQALAAVVAGLEEMSVDLSELQVRVSTGLHEEEN